MKLLLPFLLFIGTCTALSSSWYRPQLVRLGLVESRIPKFIRDLGHPYIEDNSNALESLSDPQKFLCEAVSPPDTTLPPIPVDLFARLNIDNQKWRHIQHLLTEILECKAAINGVEEFRVHINSPYEGTSLPPTDVLDLFTRVFESAPQLKSLTWMDSVPKTAEKGAMASAFRRDFTEKNIQLPNVTKMVLGAHMDFLVPAAPKLESLHSAPDFAWTWSGFRQLSREEGGPQHTLVRSLSSATQLKEFQLDADWTMELLDDLQKSAPGLQKLNLIGELREGYYGLNRGEVGRETFKTKALKVAKMKSLTDLELPHVIYLGTGDHIDEVGCGNAYFGLGGTKFGRVETLQFTEAIEEAASIVMEAIPQLKKLCIGGNCVDIENGKASKWPWTGRLRDYVLEEWPRYDSSIPRMNTGEDSLKEDPDGPVLDTWEEDRRWFQGENHIIDEL